MTFFAAIIMAVLIGSFFVYPYRRKGISAGMVLTFFFILFLAALAAGYWIVPFGPTWWGISWLPVFFITLIVAFLFAAPTPYPSRPANKVQPDNETTVNSEEASVAISIFVWIVLIGLAIAVITGIYRGGAY